ncbi:hypothetical protein KJ909_03985 [Patescibacteria group bacterium]|nr:hypothetical protein [Patescibacteria group bacterium]
MTDRLKALTVVLQKDLRDDDAEPIIEAIKQLRGVRRVTSHVTHLDDHVAYTNAKLDLMAQIWKLLRLEEEKGL